MKLNILKSKDELKKLQQSMTLQQTQMEEATSFIKEIEKGNLKISPSDLLKESGLGASLLSMQQHLSKIALEESERSWVNAGLAKFSDILRNKESLDLAALANDILMHLIKYVGANQGGIFVLEDTSHPPYLEMIACYAYDRKKHLHKRIPVGEGLAGQCVLEKAPIYLTEVPDSYVQITSGLGQAPPKAVLISPLSINEAIFGVIELAAFEPFAPYKLDFIQRLAENIASSIKNVKDTDRTKQLLAASQQQSEELKAQEEEMRQNVEEMQATQEEMARKAVEIARASAESEGILKGIDATMATIEFTPEGVIKQANQDFLNAVQYPLHDIVGKHHRMFVPKEMQESNEYADFWKKLASGQSHTGIFKRVNAHGNTVWLNAIYNPILNDQGKVEKVVKFATDITQEQEALAENKGLLQGINTTMATIEFSPSGMIQTANANFLKAVGYSHFEIVGKHHRIFVPDDVLSSDDYRSFWQRLGAGTPISGVFKRKDATGKTIWLNAIYNPILNADQEVIKVIKLASDVTSEKEKEQEIKALLEESKAQEEEIRQNLEEMQSIQEETQRHLEERTVDLRVREEVFGITTILSEADLQGNIVYANQKLVEVSQYSQEEMIGKPHNLFRHPDMPKELFRIFWTTLKKGEVFKGIVKNKAKDGSSYWVDGCFVPIKDASGKVLRYVGARYHILDEAMATRMYNEQALKLGLPLLGE